MFNVVQADVPYFALFVPASRPDRYANAAASGASAIIIDLEDSVAPGAKAMARGQLQHGITAIRAADVGVFIRINAVGTRWHDDDLGTVAALPVHGVMLPKCQRVEDVDDVRRQLGGTRQVIALIETPLGVVHARAIAATAERLAFGSLDYSISIGADHSRQALMTARAELVLAAALAGKAGPLDGVTVNTSDSEQVLDDARYGASLGMGGKLLIHPRQVAPAKRGFLPTAADLERARRILSASGSGVAAVDGMMVDAPVLAWAKRVVTMAQSLDGGS
jgi:citrate lyase subunit beta/citryl-CoA lyase